MTPDSYRNLKSIFEAAVELNPEARRAYLDVACAGDPELRRAVEALLAAEDPTTNVLGRAVDGLFPLQTPERHAGEIIDCYRLVRQIGTGGMGVVWEAERADEHYQQRVAIKLLKRGMDSDAIVSRFRYERQILAALNHPNIARLYDGGVTPDGEPYFVMEYVAGIAIDEYCRRQKLALEPLVRLFRDVCTAVQHAQQRFVIHRDLKPGNILVTENGVVKLLDFGIAKLVDATLDDQMSIALTQPGVRVMTPQYASPEQIMCQAVSTASDVYSLGLILYELITGQPARGAAATSLAEFERKVLQQPIRRPSTVISAEKASELGFRKGVFRRKLSPDLDNIILMAIRKEPERRYSTAEELGEDLRRYLGRLPVTAHGDSVSYRAGKFIQRHKQGVAAGAVVAVALAVGAASTAYQARIAERNFNDVRTLANTFLFEFEESIATLPGATPVRQMVVSRALQFLERLSSEAERDASLRRELATAYRKIADIQGNPFAANLGDTKGALHSYERAIGLLPADEAGSERDRFDVVQRIAQLYIVLGDANRGLRIYEEVLPLIEKWVAADPSSKVRQRALEVNQTRLGDALLLTGDSAGALKRYEAALAIGQNIVSQDSTDRQAVQELAVCFSKVGDAQGRLGRLMEAVESQRQSLTLTSRVAAESPTNAALQRELRVTHSKLAALLNRMGKTQEALGEAETALKLAAELEKFDPQNAMAARDLSIAHLSVGDMLLDSGQPEHAAPHYTTAVTIRRRLSATDSENRIAVRDLGVALSRIVELERARRHLQIALQAAREVAVLSERLAGLDSGNTLLQSDLATDLETLADLQLETGDPASALTQLRRTVAIRESLLKEDSQNAELQGDLALTYIKRGDASQAIRRTEEAVQDYNAAAVALSDLKNRNALTPAYTAALTSVSAKLRALP